MKRPAFKLPDPDLQIGFSARLVQARKEYLQQAVLATVGQCDGRELDQEAHRHVPLEAYQALATRGMRAELVFALPSLLKRKGRLLAYYRLVLGYSQKIFYGQGTGLSLFKSAEETGVLTEEQVKHVDTLCQALNHAAAVLVAGVTGDLSARHIEDLSLLTLGAQFRGSRNVALGSVAVQRVFDVIREIIGERATRVEDRLIEFTDATGRTVQVRFGSDPDIEAVSVHPVTGAESPMLAIEIKGGTDISNAHNRLGEAEKSHLKAKKERGFTDLWTIVNVEGLSSDARRRASPTTTAFFDLSDILKRNGEAFEAFKDRLLQKLRLPA